MKQESQAEILSLLPQIFPGIWANSYGQDSYGLWQGVILNDIELRFRWIPPGEFIMGSPEDEPKRLDDEGPQHRVVLNAGFWMAETVCTQELWQAVTNNNPSRFKEGPQRPVENISWENANNFINKLNRLNPGLELRLPSEAEWEYACRAGTDTPFWFGDELTPDKANYDGNYPDSNSAKGKFRKKIPVKSFKQNPWGLYQMHGNVWEWCQDHWHDNYNEAPDNGSAWEDGESNSRVCRGGSWDSYGWHLRSAYRGHRHHDFGYDHCGLRLARDSQQPEARTSNSRSGEE